MVSSRWSDLSSETCLKNQKKEGKRETFYSSLSLISWNMIVTFKVFDHFNIWIISELSICLLTFFLKIGHIFLLCWVILNCFLDMLNIWESRSFIKFPEEYQFALLCFIVLSFNLVSSDWIVSVLVVLILICFSKAIVRLNGGTSLMVASLFISEPLLCCFMASAGHRWIGDLTYLKCRILGYSPAVCTLEYCCLSVHPFISPLPKAIVLYLLTGKRFLSAVF